MDGMSRWFRAPRRRQAVRYEQIFGARLRLLAEIPLTAETTQETLSEQREVLLPALLAKRALERGRRRRRPEAAVPPPQARFDRQYPPPITDPTETRERLHSLTALPYDRVEAEQDATLFRELGGATKDALRRLGRDEVRVLMTAGFGPGLYRRRPWMREAVDRGLVQEAEPPLVDPRDPDFRVFALTPAGRRLARYWTSPSPRPDYFAELGVPDYSPI
jgi:hypothetical protein